MGQSRRNQQRKPPQRITRPTAEDLEEIKERLGPELAARYTREQLIQLNLELNIGSQLLLELYMQRRNGEKGTPEKG